MGVMVLVDKIFVKVKEIGVDIIGLSGLIMFLLDEMVYVVKEMEWQGFIVLLLIGGVMIFKIYIVVKVEFQYFGFVVYVLDVFWSVLVVSSLFNENES